MILPGDALISVLSFIGNLHDEFARADLVDDLVVVPPQVGRVLGDLGPGAAQDALQGHLQGFLHLGEQAERVQVGYYRGIF